MESKREDLFTQWNHSVGSSLRSKLIHAGVQVLSEVIRSASGYDASLLKVVKEHVEKSICLVVDAIHDLQQVIMTEVLDTDERDSRPRSIVDAVEAGLVDIYWRALTTIKGKDSTARQKVQAGPVSSHYLLHVSHVPHRNSSMRLSTRRPTVCS